MFRKDLSLELKKKRAKISWLVFLSVYILFVVLCIVFHVNLVETTRSLIEPGNEVVVAAMVIIAALVNGYLFYTLLSILIDTEWRNLGKILMGVLILDCGGLAIAGVIRLFYLLVS